MLLKVLSLMVIVTVAHAQVRFTDAPDRAISLKKDNYVYFCTLPLEQLTDTEFKLNPVMCVKVHQDEMSECTPLLSTEGNLDCPNEKF
jgi:hypothetical protein